MIVCRALVVYVAYSCRWALLLVGALANERQNGAVVVNNKHNFGLKIELAFFFVVSADLIVFFLLLHFVVLIIDHTDNSLHDFNAIDYC